MQPLELKNRIVEVALDRKAQGVTVIDIRGRASYADFLVLASGTSDRHVQSIAELVDNTLAREGNHSMGKEGLREGQWALIDFGSVVCHVFHHFTRSEFGLENLWEEAPQEHFESPENTIPTLKAPLPDAFDGDFAPNL